MQTEPLPPIRTLGSSPAAYAGRNMLAKLPDWYVRVTHGDGQPNALLSDNLPTTTADEIAAAAPPAATRDRSIEALFGVIGDEPVESGMDHPAASAVARFAMEHADDLRRAFELAGRYPGLQSSLLLLLGRTRDIAGAVQVDLVRAGLANTSVAVREAAIQAAEEWAGPSVLCALQAHTESEAWLARYLAQVIQDLSA
jgi:hypothetical protein